MELSNYFNANKNENTIKEIDLNPNTSWIKYNNNISNELKVDKKDFEILWNLHPIEKGKIKIFNKEIETPRWQQSYGISYKFSGTINIAEEIPEIINKYIIWANSVDTSEGEFNMALVNWYEDGNHYIGEHSDDEMQLINNSPIYCFSFGEERDFILINKKDRTDKTKLYLENNSLIIMGGTCQKTHKHTLPKRLRKKNRRISITLRKFKN